MKRRNGFTIIEIVVSVAILIVIAASIFPVFNFLTLSSSTNKIKIEAERIANSRMEKIKTMLFQDIGTVEGEPSGSIEPTEEVTANNMVFNVETEVDYFDDHEEIPYKTVTIRVLAPEIVESKSGTYKVYYELVTMVTEKGEFMTPPPTPDPSGIGQLNLVLLNMIKNEDDNFQYVNEETLINPLTVTVRRNGAIVKQVTTSVYQYESIMNGMLVKLSGIDSSVLGNFQSAIGYTVSIDGELTNFTEHDVIHSFKFNENTNIYDIVNMYHLRTLPKWNGRIDVDETVSLICPVYTNGLYKDIEEGQGEDDGTVVTGDTIELIQKTFALPQVFGKDNTYDDSRNPGDKGLYNVFRNGNTWNAGIDEYYAEAFLWEKGTVKPHFMDIEFLDINAPPLTIRVHALRNYSGPVPGPDNDGSEMSQAFDEYGEEIGYYVDYKDKKHDIRFNFDQSKSFRYFRISFESTTMGDDKKGICQVKQLKFSHSPNYYEEGTHISGPFSMYDYPKDISIKIHWDETGAGIDGSKVEAWYGFSFSQTVPPSDENGWIPITNGYTFNPGFIPSNTFIWIKHRITPSYDENGVGYQTPQVINIQVDFVVPGG